MQITINEEILTELQYIIKLHQAAGAPAAFDNVPDMVNYVLGCVADGSRRPGAWEREMLDQMGIVANCDEHHVYRPSYGEAPK